MVCTTTGHERECGRPCPACEPAGRLCQGCEDASAPTELAGTQAGRCRWRRPAHPWPEPLLAPAPWRASQGEHQSAIGFSAYRDRGAAPEVCGWTTWPPTNRDIREAPQDSGKTRSRCMSHTDSIQRKSAARPPLSHDITRSRACLRVNDDLTIWTSAATEASDSR